MNKEIEIKLINPKMVDYLPRYSTVGSAGIDLRASIDNSVTIAAGETILIPSGIALHIKDVNLAAIVIPRSGLGFKHGIVLGNLIGLIDSDYQGEIKISLWNRSDTPFTITPFERVVQLVIVPIVQATFQIVDQFTDGDSVRGEGGFGSTGVR